MRATNCSATNGSTIINPISDTISIQYNQTDGEYANPRDECDKPILVTMPHNNNESVIDPQCLTYDEVFDPVYIHATKAALVYKTVCIRLECIMHHNIINNE